MDSCATLHGAPRSFATLYDAAPPFSTNLSSGDFRFSSLPTKRNAAAPETSILFQLGETLKRAASPLSRNSENGKNQRSRSLSPVRQQIDDSYLDFERVLKPLMDNTCRNVVVAGSAPVLDQPHYRQSQGHRCLSTSDIPVVPVSLQSSDPQMRSDPYLRPPPQRRNPFMVEEHRNSIINLPSSNQWSLLNSLRIHAGTPERSEDGIEKLLQYYAQLLNLSQKFDFESGRHSINFNWYEAYSPDRQITHSCIHYEMACVLFNVAAVYSQIACAQRLSTTDGKKLAAAYFKKSAGVLMHVRDTHCQRAQIRLEKTSDLTDQFLTASAQVMLAQAMECYFEKANDDKVSSPTMSMLATQTADYYELALRHSKEGIHILSRQRFPRTWIQQLTAKSFIYAAIAHFHAPLSLPAEQALGERIARLTIAKNLATRAFKSSSSIGGTVHDIVKGYLDVITSSHLLADAANFEKHNHAAVDASLVTALKRPNEALVVPIPAAESIGDLQRFSDVFAGFKPVEEDLNLEVLSTFAVEVVERASRNLEAHRKEIEAEIKRHNVMETSTLKEILSVNKERANAIWEHIQVIQMDERKESYSDLMKRLDLMHIAINTYIHEVYSF
ncbi:BRO1-domain-containing protein [Rhizoclosmatium globosum]|uniref:BRO domain-containing protein 1 n=1 Tax=Rhizoclosmatium globosum TaxID=329046 RepID=A0A1Y2BQ17_9FUNG|nr:BRO1-domain-containing protein [Rhizoclosmatium globosum]|eukprot:ORY36707.1 BRO1-domain-containing protein [Rhizoclosmatium globosum]